MRAKLTSIFDRGWIRAILSGLLVAACFPPLDLGYLAFFALIPLIYSLKGVRPKVAFRLGHLSGFVAFGLTFDWMTIFAYGKGGFFGACSGLLLAAILALFTGAWAVAVSITLNSSRIADWIKPAVIASLAVLLDYVRQLGALGMGLGDIGYSQWRDPIVMSVAPLAGIWGMTWIVTMINALFVIRGRSIVTDYLCVTLLFCGLGRLASMDVRPAGQPYVAAALQANIDQDVYWTGGRPSDPAYFTMTMDTFSSLASQAAAKGATLAVTAETSMPGYIDIDPDLQSRIYKIAKTNNLAILAGGREYDYTSRKDKNVLALFSPTQPLAAQGCEKQQLVPFGEFVPFQNLIGWISVLRVANFNMEAGGLDQPPIDAGPGIGKISTVVCYDMTYPRCIRSQLLNGATLLTVGSDDTWFGHTAESKQSEAINAVRAAESDRYLVRTSATGISAIIDNQGRVIAEIPLFTRGFIAEQVQPMTGNTIFVHYGDWWVGFCVLIVAAAGAMARKAHAHELIDS